VAQHMLQPLRPHQLRHSACNALGALQAHRQVIHRLPRFPRAASFGDLVLCDSCCSSSLGCWHARRRGKGRLGACMDMWDLMAGGFCRRRACWGRSSLSRCRALLVLLGWLSVLLLLLLLLLLLVCSGAVKRVVCKHPLVALLLSTGERIRSLGKPFLLVLLVVPSHVLCTMEGVRDRVRGLDEEWEGGGPTRAEVHANSAHRCLENRHHKGAQSHNHNLQALLCISRQK